MLQSCLDISAGRVCRVALPDRAEEGDVRVPQYVFRDCTLDNTVKLGSSRPYSGHSQEFWHRNNIFQRWTMVVSAYTKAFQELFG